MAVGVDRNLAQTSSVPFSQLKLDEKIAEGKIVVIETTEEAVVAARLIIEGKADMPELPSEEAEVDQQKENAESPIENATVVVDMEMKTGAESDDAITELSTKVDFEQEGSQNEAAMDEVTEATENNIATAVESMADAVDKRSNDSIQPVAEDMAILEVEATNEDEPHEEKPSTRKSRRKHKGKDPVVVATSNIAESDDAIIELSTKVDYFKQEGSQNEAAMTEVTEVTENTIATAEESMTVEPDTVEKRSNDSIQPVAEDIARLEVQATNDDELHEEKPSTRKSRRKHKEKDPIVVDTSSTRRGGRRGKKADINANVEDESFDVKAQETNTVANTASDDMQVDQMDDMQTFDIVIINSPTEVPETINEAEDSDKMDETKQDTVIESAKVIETIEASPKPHEEQQQQQQEIDESASASTSTVSTAAPKSRKAGKAVPAIHIPPAKFYTGPKLAPSPVHTSTSATVAPAAEDKMEETEDAQPPLKPAKNSGRRRKAKIEEQVEESEKHEDEKDVVEEEKVVAPRRAGRRGGRSATAEPKMAVHGSDDEEAKSEGDSDSEKDNKEEAPTKQKMETKKATRGRGGKRGGRSKVVEVVHSDEEEDHEEEEKENKVEIVKEEEKPKTRRGGRGKKAAEFATEPEDHPTVVEDHSDHEHQEEEMEAEANQVRRRGRATRMPKNVPTTSTAASIPVPTDEESIAAPAKKRGRTAKAHVEDAEVQASHEEEQPHRVEPAKRGRRVAAVVSATATLEVIGFEEESTKTITKARGGRKAKAEVPATPAEVVEVESGNESDEPLAVRVAAQIRSKRTAGGTKSKKGVKSKKEDEQNAEEENNDEVEKEEKPARRTTRARAR
jgi:hypothetical protein